MTISDIAKMAGVSSAAVSRYLNGGPLSEQKRAVIHEVVEKTGYRPDTAAQTLRTGKVNQVGVIAPSIGSQSVGQTRQALPVSWMQRAICCCWETPSWMPSGNWAI